MKIPISKRLRLCAQLVPEGARVADIGTDHGYLGLYLLQNGLAAHVLAADLRPQPLQTAKLHAAKFGFAGQMEFRLSDGLAEIRSVSNDEKPGVSPMYVPSPSA